MDKDNNKLPASKRQMRHFRKGRVIILLTVIIFLVVGGSYAFLGRPSSTPSSTNMLENTFFLKEKINILVLGVDARDDDVGRSDTIFVVTIDTIGKNITMLSIPRDSRVKINDQGWDKINHAYAFGGSKLSKTSVEHLLGIGLDYTVVMDVRGFVRMIDALGGVTIDVDRRMYYSDPYDDDGGLYIDLRPGIQKLNGRTAIEYVRYRDEDGDIGRVARQQKFLKALLQEFSKPQLITKLPDLIKEFVVAVRTDMPTKKMVMLIPIINDAAKVGLRTEWLSGTPCWIQDISYWLLDIKELRYKVAQIQGITVDEDYTQVTELFAKEYANSVPREIRAIESAPLIKESVKLDKQRIDSTKALATTIITPINKVANKPKPNNIPANGGIIPDSKNTSNKKIKSE